MLQGLKSPLCGKSAFIKGLEWTFHLPELHGLHLFFQGLNITGICCVLVTDYICLSLHQESVAFFKWFFILFSTIPTYQFKKNHLSRLFLNTISPFHYPWTSSGKITVQKGLHACLHIFPHLLPEVPFPTHVWIGLSKIISTVGSWKAFWV